VCSSDLQK